MSCFRYAGGLFYVGWVLENRGWGGLDMGYRYWRVFVFVCEKGVSGWCKRVVGGHLRVGVFCVCFFARVSVSDRPMDLVGKLPGDVGYVCVYFSCKAVFQV